jgi:nucleoside-diphosphate-sugar epimerase
MTYLIFGGSGFIGTHLVALLKEQYPLDTIINLDLVENNHDGKSIYVNCDVRKEINLNIPISQESVIFNFAAVHRTPGHLDHAYFETNIFGAENVTAFAEKHGVKKIVFTSSIAPYGAAEDLKEETTIPTPNTPYGISKLVAEKIHMIWQARNQAERQLTIVRPGVVFGKGENGNFTRLYWGIREHKFMYPGRKDTIKACIYVKELVRFMLYRLEHHEQGVELYNCTFEPAYTIEQIVESMKKVTGIKHSVPLIPAWILMLAAAVAGCLGTPMGICTARVKKLMISTNICGKKLSDSGYKFHYTFEEAIKDWFKDNNNLYLK